MNHEMKTKNVRKSKNEQAWINIRVKIQQAYIQHQASPTTDTDY